MSQPPRAHDAGLYLLFAKGRRPDRLAIKALADRLPHVTVTHDPRAGQDGADNSASGDSAAGDRAALAPGADAAIPPRDPVPDMPTGQAAPPGASQWLELLRDGLTFDLGGLAPGPSAAFPAASHRFDLSALPQADDYEALTLRPGPHVASGGNAMPLMRSLLALACDLARQFDDLTVVVWPPAASAIGRRFFESATSAWLDGGPFPALGLTAFAQSPEGGLESVGLSFWIGQELRIEPPLSADRVAATRLGIRLVNYLLHTGGLAEDDRIAAPDGTRLVLRPSRTRALVSVWRE